MKKLYFILVVVVFFSLHLSPSDKQSHRLLRSSGPVRVIEDKTCTICQRAIDLLGLREHISLPCSHMFHSTCFRPWQLSSSTCPICRNPFREDVITIDSGVAQITIAVLLRIVAFLEEQAEASPELRIFLQDNFDSMNGLITLFAVCSFIQTERLDDALRVARSTGNQDLVDYVIRQGADPLIHQIGEQITLSIDVAGLVFAAN